MGMGYGANYADIIDNGVIAKTCPEELKALDKAIENAEYDFECFAQEAQYGDFPDDMVEKAFDILTTAFQKKTGLGLNIGFHDQHDEGDRYDQVNGAFWSVDGVYELTEAGKKYEKYINRQMYVSFG